MLGAELPCDVELLARSSGGHHDAALGRDQLHEQLPDPAGGGVHQGDVIGLDGMGAVDQVVRRQPLQHGRGRRLQADTVGHRNQRSDRLVDDRRLAAR